MAFVLGLSGILISCDRPSSNQGSSQITIQMPQATTASIRTMQSESLRASGSNNGPSFGLSPTAFSSLNCYYIFVGGPESSMANNSCQVASGNSFSFGVMAGPIAAGAQATLQVPAGSNRSLFMGGYAIDSSVYTSCPALTNVAAIAAHISSPVFLGSVGGINLTPGATVSVSVPVTATLLATNAIQNCSGSISGNTGGGNTSPPPVTYAFFPQDMRATFFAGTCVPLNLKIVDSTGSGANVQGTYVASLSSQTLSGTGSVSFFSDSACQTPLNYPAAGQSQFSGYSQNGMFMLMPATAATFSLTATPVSGTTALKAGTSSVYSVTTAPTPPYYTHLVDGRSLNTMTSASTWPAPVVCWPYIIQAQDSTGMPVTFSQAGGLSSYDYFSASGMAFGSSMTDSICAGTASTQTTLFNTTYNSYTNYPVFGYSLPSSSVTLTPYLLSTSQSPTITYTTPTAGNAAQVGISSNQGPTNSSSPTSSFSFMHPTMGCQYVGEFGCYDSAGNRQTSCTGVGFMSLNHLAISGLVAGVLYSDSACTADFFSSNYTGFTGATIRVPLYSSTAAAPGIYNLTFSLGTSTSYSQSGFTLTVQ